MSYSNKREVNLFDLQVTEKSYWLFYSIFQFNHSSLVYLVCSTASCLHASCKKSFFIFLSLLTEQPEALNKALQFCITAFLIHIANFFGIKAATNSSVTLSLFYRTYLYSIDLLNVLYTSYKFKDIFNCYLYC